LPCGTNREDTMKLLDTVRWSDAQREAFEDRCFRDWLNIVDARLDYDVRRQIELDTWRRCFDLGYSANEAVAMSKSGFVDLEG
jgi:hypothetical protein